MVSRRPKAGYAAKLRSHIRMAVLEKFQIDLVDASVPGAQETMAEFHGCLS